MTKPAFDMLAAASVRLRQLVDEIEQLKAKSAPQRIAGFFVKQTPLASGPARIALPYEKALIASRLGMKPESFSRALGRLEELGVVVDRESVSISDVGKLAAFAEGTRLAAKRRMSFGRMVGIAQLRPPSQSQLPLNVDSRRSNTWDECCARGALDACFRNGRSWRNLRINHRPQTGASVSFVVRIDRQVAHNRRSRSSLKLDVLARVYVERQH